LYSVQLGSSVDNGDVYCRDSGAALVALHSRRSSSGTMTSDSGASQFYAKVIIRRSVVNAWLEISFSFANE